MGQTLDKVLTGARNIIESITPDVDSHITFARAPMNGELEALPFATPSEGTRRFHVISGVLAGTGGPSRGTWNANEINHLLDMIVVRVRYHCPLRRGGYGSLDNYVSTDAHRIFHALVNANAAAWGGSEYCPQLIDPAGSISLTEVGNSTELADTFILNYPMRVQIILGAS